MSHFTAKVAVVTGAGSGIGRALSLELVRRGAKVAMSDVDTVALAETESLARALGGDIKVDALNVAEREAFMGYADDVATHFGKVNLIFNNAGIAFTGDVEETEFKDIDRVMDVDFWGVVNGTKAFLRTSSPPATVMSSTCRASSEFSACLHKAPTTRRSLRFVVSPNHCARRC